MRRLDEAGDVGVHELSHVSRLGSLRRPGMNSLSPFVLRSSDTGRLPWIQGIEELRRKRCRDEELGFQRAQKGTQALQRGLKEGS